MSQISTCQKLKLRRDRRIEEDREMRLGKITLKMGMAVVRKENMKS